MRSMRVHGEGRHRYEAVRIGTNGRFDTIQAAVLIEKLKIFSEEIAARNSIARRYSEHLADLAQVPQWSRARPRCGRNTRSVCRRGRREPFAAALRAQGIPTAV